MYIGSKNRIFFENLLSRIIRWKATNLNWKYDDVIRMCFMMLAILD
jgi:hypothetical protein